MTKLDSIIKKINQNSKMPIENENLLRKYIWESLKGKNLITFYNWECPPRVLDKDKKGKLFVNYRVDLEKIFRGEKIDEYTEIPRIVKEKKREIKILKFLMSLGLRFRFVKVIADTNAYYITPGSLKILGNREIENTFLEFERKIEKILKKDYRLVNTKTFLFTVLMKKYRKKYENIIDKTLKILDSDFSRLVKLDTWNNEINYLKSHIGFKDGQQKEVKDIAKRVIATYGAEGIIFGLLSETKYFSNCVWMNIEEANSETVDLTNYLRIAERFGKLPMIFPK